MLIGKNPSIFAQYERVIRILCSQGHRIVMLLNSLIWRNAKMDTKVLSNYQKLANGSFSFRIAPKPSGYKSLLYRLSRELINYMAYIRKKEPISFSPYMVDRAAQVLPSPLNRIAIMKPIQTILKEEKIASLLMKIDRNTDADKIIKKTILNEKPDLVVASPYIFSRSEEIEYVKAANQLGIRTAASVFSWDNLTSKGIFQIIPTAVLVWNKAQVDELEKIHKVPSEISIWTGAPSLDFWFEKKQSISREIFCKNYGINHQKPFVLYLCSSQTIARDEHLFVKQMITKLRKHFGDSMPSLVIRPHPLNLKIWDGFYGNGTAVVPRSNRDIFYSEEARKLFYHTIKFSSLVMGLNTTAMIEATIVDKPCISIITPRYSSTQKQSGHFHHLTDANILLTTNNFEEVALLIQKILSGNDLTRDARKNFVETFIRPWGFDRPASNIMARVLIELASGYEPTEIIPGLNG